VGNKYTASRQKKIKDKVGKNMQYLHSPKCRCVVLRVEVDIVLHMLGNVLTVRRWDTERNGLTIFEQLVNGIARHFTK
jgi:hypothetical protein